MPLNPHQFPGSSPLVSAGGVWNPVEHDADNEGTPAHLSGVPTRKRPGDQGMSMSVRANPDSIEHDKPYSWNVSTSGAKGSPIFMQSGSVSSPQRGMIAAEAAVNRRVEGRDPQTGRRVR